MNNRYRNRLGGRTLRSSSYPSRKRADKRQSPNATAPDAMASPAATQGNPSDKVD